MINQSELGLASASHVYILGELLRRLLELCRCDKPFGGVVELDFKINLSSSMEQTSICRVARMLSLSVPRGVSVN